MSPPSLSKRKPDGTVYTRPAEVESALQRILELPRDDVRAALSVRDRSDPKYLPSECILHLIRRTRMDNRDTYFQELYQALMARVDRALPRFEYEIGDDTGVDLSRARIRDEVRDRLAEMIIADRNAAATRLDFFEARFAAGVAKLRRTAQEKIWRDDGRRRPLEPLEETGELSIEVERAAGSMDLPSSEKWDDPFYRSRLQAAIDALPPEQSRIIEMLQKGIPIESQDPDAPSICKIEGCVEKTVRNRRDAAIRALRQALDLGDTK